MLQDLQSLLPAVLDIARDAGRAVLDVYEQNFTVTQKADRSPVTEADLRAERIILDRLRSLTPLIPALSEESSAPPAAERLQWRELWMIDPLDGTREFVARNPNFTVNIALVRNGQPVLGVVHAPVQQLYYYACRQAAASKPGVAFRRQGDGLATPIQVSPSATPIRVLNSRLHRGTGIDKFLAQLGPHRTTELGSSLKFCLIAEGAADLYPRLWPTMEWDTAAGQAVLECAGGRVFDLNGRTLSYNQREELTNPHFIACGATDRDWLQCFKLETRGPVG